MPENNSIESIGNSSVLKNVIQHTNPFSLLLTSSSLIFLILISGRTAKITIIPNVALGRLVIANFNNQNGLKQIGNATYVETSVSGTAIVGEAGADGFGTILSGSLERSNVDITEELVSLITAQRNFQANAKSIETNSTITQAIINIRS